MQLTFSCTYFTKQEVTTQTSIYLSPNLRISDLNQNRTSIRSHGSISLDNYLKADQFFSRIRNVLAKRVAMFDSRKHTLYSIHFKINIPNNSPSPTKSMIPKTDRLLQAQRMRRNVKARTTTQPARMRPVNQDVTTARVTPRGAAT